MMKLWVPLKGRVQTELIKRGHCVGCTKSLAEAERRSYRNDEGKDLVACSCGRIYIYEKLINSYRRAGFEEIR